MFLFMGVQIPAFYIWQIWGIPGVLLDLMFSHYKMTIELMPGASPQHAGRRV